MQVIGLEGRFEGRQIVVSLNALAEACGGVMAHLPFKSEGYVALGGARVMAIGTSVFDEHLSLAMARTRLRSFLRSISGVRARPYLTGVDDVEIGRLAEELGFALLSGPAIVEDAARPNPRQQPPGWTIAAPHDPTAKAV